MLFSARYYLPNCGAALPELRGWCRPFASKGGIYTRELNVRIGEDHPNRQGWKNGHAFPVRGAEAGE
jgi:hypothetical protein